MNAFLIVYETITHDIHSKVIFYVNREPKMCMLYYLDEKSSIKCMLEILKY